MHRGSGAFSLTRGITAAMLCAAALCLPPAHAGRGAPTRPILISGGGQGHGGADWTYLLTAADGEGALRRDGDVTMRVAAVIVDLSRNGQASVRLLGRSDLEFTGKWERKRPNTLALTLYSGFNTLRVKGSGTIELRDDKHVRSITLEGQRKKDAQPFAATFTAAGEGEKSKA